MDTRLPPPLRSFPASDTTAGSSDANAAASGEARALRSGAASPRSVAQVASAPRGHAATDPGGTPLTARSLAALERRHAASDPDPERPIERAASVQSTFGDRPGVLDPPRTLGLLVTSWAHLEVLDFLLNESVRCGFDVFARAGDLEADGHPSDPPDSAAHIDRLALERGFVETGSNGPTAVYRHPSRSDSRVTVDRGGTGGARREHWPKDGFLFGKNSLHMLSGRFDGRRDGFRDGAIGSVEARRMTAWQALRVAAPRDFHHFMGVGLRVAAPSGAERAPHRDPPAVYSPALAPETPATEALDARTGPPRTFRPNRSIEAYVEGGNFLTNGAERGERVHVIGLDAVAATQAGLEMDTGGAVTLERAKAHVQEQLRPAEGDRVVFVEQSGFHIDTALLFVGRNREGKDEVVVSRCADAAAQPRGWRTGLLERNDRSTRNLLPELVLINRQRLEAACANALEAEGIVVHRKPWASVNPKGFNMLNGEYVTSNDGKVHYVTNGYFDVSSDGRRAPGAQETKRAGEMERQVREFFAERDIEVLFAPRQTSRTFLSHLGGMGCILNAIRM